MNARDVPALERLLEDGERYDRGGMLEKALECYERAERAATSPGVIAEAARRRAGIHRKRCDWEEAFTAARRSQEVARRAELADAFAEALNGEAAIYLSRGEFEKAEPLLQRMTEVTDTPRIRGIALQNLGSVAARQGDVEGAERRFLASSEHFQCAGYVRGEAVALNNYAAIALDREDYEAARAIGDRAVSVARNVGDLELVAIAMKNFAEALAGVERYGKAEEFASAALGYFDVAGNEWRRVECLLLLGDISRARRAPALARRFYERGLTLAEGVGAGYEVGQLRERLAELPAVKE